MRRRIRMALACCAAVAAGACGEAEGVEVQPLPPLQRPSPEARAGLPEVRGVWRFAGFEIPARDTAAVRERVYTLVPPGEFRMATQRLDSIAGQYVREGVAFPFTGEVRRDSTVAVVAFSEGVGQFVAGRVVGDTLWIELTSFSTAQTWPTGTRAALVREAVRAPFRRLLGGVPIAPPVDSAAVRDSIRLDSLRRAGAVTPGAQPVPGQVAPGQGVPNQPITQPGVRPTVPAAQPVPQQQRPPAQVQPQQRPPVQTQPQQRPPAQTQPRPQQPRPQPQRPPVQQQPPPTVSEPVEEPQQAPVPTTSGPRDTIRFGSPP